MQKVLSMKIVSSFFIIFSIIAFDQAKLKIEFGDLKPMRDCLFNKKINALQCSLCSDENKKKSENNIICTLSHKYGCECKNKLICTKHNNLERCPICGYENIMQAYNNVELSRSLIEAIKSRHINTVNSLLEDGANPNFRINEQGLWPIMHALSQGPDFVKSLVKYGAKAGLKVLKRPDTVTIVQMTIGSRISYARRNVSVLDFLLGEVDPQKFRENLKLLSDEILLDLRSFEIDIIKNYINMSAEKEYVELIELVRKRKILLSDEGYKYYLDKIKIFFIS